MLMLWRRGDGCVGKMVVVVVVVVKEKHQREEIREGGREGMRDGWKDGWTEEGKEKFVMAGDNRMHGREGRKWWSVEGTLHRSQEEEIVGVQRGENKEKTE